MITGYKVDERCPESQDPGYFLIYGGVFSELAERRKNPPIFVRTKKNRRPEDRSAAEKRDESKDAENDFKVWF